MKGSRAAALVWLGLALVACSDEPAGTLGGGEAERSVASAVAEAWPPPGDGGFSNDGSFYVTWAARPGEVPLNETFEVDLHVWDAQTRAEIGGEAELAVDARMPAHGHGMRQAVELLRNADGSVTVKGMLFHMTGHWELYVDLTRGAVTERAQFDVDLE